MTPADPPLYHWDRALEHVVELPGVWPVRVHALAFPLWVAELSATVEEHRPFDLLDQFVSRAIAEGGFRSVAEIAEFLGVTEHMVDRVLRFLGGIGHITGANGDLSLTEQGRRSVSEGRRYVEKTERLKLYFDGASSKPLKKQHYSKGVRVISHSEGRRRFLRLQPTAEFSASAVQALAAGGDRAAYNLPDELLNLNVLSVSIAYLPCYAIRAVTDQGLVTLVYSGVPGRHDIHLEGLFASWPRAVKVFQTNDSESPDDRFGSILSECGIAPTPEILRWEDHLRARLVLPPRSFTTDHPPLKTYCSLPKLGSYVASQKGYALQLWCEDVSTRRAAGLAIALSYASSTRRTSQAAADHLADLSNRLELHPPITLEDLRSEAARTGQPLPLSQ